MLCEECLDIYDSAKSKPKNKDYSEYTFNKILYDTKTWNERTKTIGLQGFGF